MSGPRYGKTLTLFTACQRRAKPRLNDFLYHNRTKSIVHHKCNSKHLLGCSNPGFLTRRWGRRITRSLHRRHMRDGFPSIRFVVQHNIASATPKMRSYGHEGHGCRNHLDQARQCRNLTIMYCLIHSPALDTTTPNTPPASSSLPAPLLLLLCWAQVQSVQQYTPESSSRGACG